MRSSASTSTRGISSARRISMPRADCSGGRSSSSSTTISRCRPPAYACTKGSSPRTGSTSCDGPVLLARHRGGRQRDRKVQEGDGGAVGGDDRHLPEGASAQIHLHGPLARRGLLRRPHRHRDETWAQDGGRGQRGHALLQGCRGRRGHSRQEKGMQVVFQEAYPKGNTDFSGLLTKIKGVNPDVLAAATYFDDAVALTRQMRELNVNPKMHGVTIGGDLPEFYDTLKGNAEYVYGATQWEPALNYPGNREFVESYRAEFKREPSYFAAAGYAGCLVYTQGVKRAGSLDADKAR